VPYNVEQFCSREDLTAVIDHVGHQLELSGCGVYCGTSQLKLPGGFINHDVAQVYDVAAGSGLCPVKDRADNSRGENRFST